MKSQTLNTLFFLALAGGGFIVILNILKGKPEIPQCPVLAPTELSAGVRSYIDARISGLQGKEKSGGLEVLSAEVSQLQRQLADIKAATAVDDTRKLVTEFAAKQKVNKSRLSETRKKFQDDEILRMKYLMLESCQPNPEAASKAQ